MNNGVINLEQKLALFADHWSPRVVAEMNNYQLKLAKLQGDFVWHQHHHTDEVFLCLSGELTIDISRASVNTPTNYEAVVLRPGDLFVVPQGVRHRPHCESECHVLLIEPKGVVNTGETQGALTAANDLWV